MYAFCLSSRQNVIWNRCLHYINPIQLKSGSKAKPIKLSFGITQSLAHYKVMLQRHSHIFSTRNFHHEQYSWDFELLTYIQAINNSALMKWWGRNIHLIADVSRNETMLLEVCLYVIMKQLQWYLFTTLLDCQWYWYNYSTAMMLSEIESKRTACDWQ